MNAVTMETDGAVYPNLHVEASYDAGDDKLRLRASARLPRELYDRVKAAGFRWAPKQDLFYAVWRPEAEDLALELAHDIGDEDTSLVERAEERAERFEGYQEKRADEAGRAHEAVSAIADNIPLGQPILIGHHSERRARRDAERIESGMRKAVSLWETSKYWERRAAGALRHAKYKELPGVRHRRIKGLESDERKHLRERDEAMLFLKLWKKDGLTLDQARAIAGRGRGVGLYMDLESGKLTLEEAVKRAVSIYESTCEHHERWLAHVRNRLAYERAMLGEAGGIAADKFDVQVGGQVFDGSRWHIVTRVNRSGGAVTSVSVGGRSWTLGIERVRDYRAPAEGDAEKVKAASKTGPLVNYPGDGFRHMTSEQWKKISQWSEFSRAQRVAASDKHGAHRLRMAPKEGRPYYDTTGVYITDAKRVDPPAPATAPAALPEKHLPPVSAPRSRPTCKAVTETGFMCGNTMPCPYHPSKFDALKESLKAGVQVAVADQLFPTPPDLAARMAKLAGIEPGMRVLEPSAGTGVLVRAANVRGATVVAIESDGRLTTLLDQMGLADVYGLSFLECKPVDDGSTGAIGTFDAVVMNPPFSGGADVDHVTHAWGFLKPGGRLVAITSAGVRFRQDRKTAAFRALVDEHGTVEDLADGTFKESGTGVRTVLVVLDKPPACPQDASGASTPQPGAESVCTGRLDAPRPAGATTTGVVDTFPKTCSCGRTYTREQWGELEYVGQQDDEEEVYELRNCRRGSTSWASGSGD